MKNNNLQDLRPVYIHEANHHADNEINLIDIALVLARRKIMIISIFLVIIIISTVVALLTPKTFNYGSTIEIGKQIIGNTINLIEPSQTLIAKLEQGYIPQALSEHKKALPDDTNKYLIKVISPSNSNGIVLLELKGAEEQSTTVTKLLRTITQAVIQEHTKIYQTLKEDLETRLNDTTNRLKTLENSSNTPEATADTAEIIKIIDTLKFKLANLRNTQEVFPVIRSIEPTGMSRRIVIVISAFTGLFLGVAAAFFAEFMVKLKERQLGQI